MLSPWFRVHNAFQQITVQELKSAYDMLKDSSRGRDHFLNLKTKDTSSARFDFVYYSNDQRTQIPFIVILLKAHYSSNDKSLGNKTQMLRAFQWRNTKWDISIEVAKSGQSTITVLFHPKGVGMLLISFKTRGTTTIVAISDRQFGWFVIWINPYTHKSMSTWNRMIPKFVLHAFYSAGCAMSRAPPHMHIYLMQWFCGKI